jgi:hypothetical protein
LQFDVVEVSGTNQYSVKPFALVSRVAPPIFAVCSAVPDDPAAAAEVAAADGLLAPPEPADEVLPHAAAKSATAARPPGTHHRLRILLPPLQGMNDLPQTT